MTLYARHRCIEQSFGLCGRGWGWDDLRERHWNMYIIIYETNRQSRFDAWDRVFGADALGWPRGMGWGGRCEGGSEWGTHVQPWWIHVSFRPTETLLLFRWSNGCCQYDLWFLCLLQIYLEHLEVHSSHTVEAWLGEFWALLCWLVRRVQFCYRLNILWHCLSLGFEGKLTFSSPMATAVFSKFAGILSAAL